MPRKTDGMLIELHPRPTNGEDGRPLLYARPASNYKRTMKDVEDFMAFQNINSAMIETDFKNFIEVCSRWLAEGYRVETPLGVFSPKIKLVGDFTDPSKVKPQNDVSYVGIELTPSKRFIDEVRYKMKGFRIRRTSVGNAQMYDEAFMSKALRRAVHQDMGFITISSFMAASGLKYHSAHRYLDHLCYCQNPTLKCKKVGNSYHYYPVKK